MKIRRGGGTCALELLLSFPASNRNLKLMNTTCVDSMPAFTLATSSDLMRKFMGTDDNYDGIYMCNSSLSSA
ncbi:hypothetical protein GN958_ATG09674 [Phytophthora infestans]|uniref:Uncharacterized protein n=1 Tax=Phytophthora infestans TaxID=4787 RepID=A0A8S9UJR5_PHYIN|nr:hypothetical protein GN958_ATG09674 [Phytophthora infestans]